MLIQTSNNGKVLSTNTDQEFIRQVFTSINPLSASGERYGSKYLPRFIEVAALYPAAEVKIETENKRVELSLATLIALLQAEVTLTVIRTNLPTGGRGRKPKDVTGGFFQVQPEPKSRGRKPVAK